MKSFKIYSLNFSILIISVLIFSEAQAFGENRGSRKPFSYKIKVGGTAQMYSGTDKLSFAGGDPAYGAELMFDMGGSYLRYFLRTRYTSTAGKQNFIKSGTTYNTSYDFTALEQELGLSFYPFENNGNMNLYIWGAGVFSQNKLNLTTVPAGLGLTNSYSENGTGFSGGIGLDFSAPSSKNSGRSLSKWHFYGELGYRDSRAALAGQGSFEISGTTISLGIGF